jgi:hypothetical protein
MRDLVVTFVFQFPRLRKFVLDEAVCEVLSSGAIVARQGAGKKLNKYPRLVPEHFDICHSAIPFALIVSMAGFRSLLQDIAMRSMA